VTKNDGRKPGLDLSFSLSRSSFFSALLRLGSKKGAKMGFVPIRVVDYIKLHVKSNPDENPVALRKRFRRCIADALGGARCHCGAPIWVIGSVFVGNMCFTCITGEGYPTEDYEIDKVLKAREASESDDLEDRD
jgi:hypothetical protein